MGFNTKEKKRAYDGKRYAEVMADKKSALYLAYRERKAHDMHMYRERKKLKEEGQ